MQTKTSVTYLRLWDYVGQLLPKRAAKGTVADWLPPKELEGALRSLYRSYEKAYQHWETVLRALPGGSPRLHCRLPQHRRQQACL